MAKIHPSSVVMDGAVLDDSVEVGPLCYVGPHVKIGAGTRLIAHCCVDGHTTIGENNTIHPFASLGQPAQDHAVEPGAVTYLKVGNGNIFRECCTIHTGTKPETETVIGNNCMFMACSHVAHNCRIGNDVIFVNNSCVAGYSPILGDANAFANAGASRGSPMASQANVTARTWDGELVPLIVSSS